MNMVAASARKDYEQRRERQAQGIEKANKSGAYKGRPVDREKRERIRQRLAKGFSIRQSPKLAGAAPSTVQRVKLLIGRPPPTAILAATDNCPGIERDRLKRPAPGVGPLNLSR